MVGFEFGFDSSQTNPIILVFLLIIVAIEQIFVSSKYRKHWKSMLVLVSDFKNSWICIIKHILLLINENTIFNILNAFFCKIMKRKLKCILKLCPAIWQDFGHFKNRVSNVCEKEEFPYFLYLIQIFAVEKGSWQYTNSNEYLYYFSFLLINRIHALNLTTNFQFSV